MTSTIPNVFEHPLGDDNNAIGTTAPPPRKRRRRTAAGGATDDCFTCRSRGVQCDRKRPYCTQCIEIGKECSGYKTTLTWGVGVASRGKLRGLSCPIANKNADGSDVSPAEMEARRRRKSSTSKPKREEPASDSSGSNASFTRTSPMAISTTSTTPAFPQPSAPVGLPPTHVGWQVPGFQDHVQSMQERGGRNMSLSNAALRTVHTGINPQFDGLDVPRSGHSVGSYTESEFYSPMEYPHTPNSLPFTEPLQPPRSVPFSEQPMTVPSTKPFPPLGGSMDSYSSTISSSVESLQSHSAFPEFGTADPTHSETGYKDMLFSQADPLRLTPVTSATLSYASFDEALAQVQEDEAETQNKEISLLDTRFSSPFFHISPRLQTLMEYYDRNICPYLVAFDGPDNPYRTHVLQLAMSNEGLQNAIAALATNNLRMRKKEARSIGLVDEIADAFNGLSPDDLSEPTPEESSYKQMSIDQLNRQLVSRRAAQDDSVLATLLILCLFHVCDSGFSKFKTQLAGVQKLLTLRDASTQSDFTRWVEMFFTWFDVMTSTVNDREIQIKGESMGLPDLSANLGAMEQFSGCDGRLFKLIARLGRLNLLAQGRPVRRESDRTPRPTPLQRSVFRSVRRKGPSRFPLNKSLSAADYENIDGNGWGTPILSSDEDADGSADEDLVVPDERREFWTEWHDLRSRLESWQMDVSSIPSAGSPTDAEELEAGRRDLIHINESFRCSALLYTERLGYPLVPSSHGQFQRLVSSALYHIEALPITSCVNKFLLWPLFITGTECVDEGHRNIIRARCIEVQKESGFFNNISSLDVLEKVWSEIGWSAHRNDDEEVIARRRDSEASQPGRYRQAFRWRRAMDRVDGEYIVI